MYYKLHTYGRRGFFLDVELGKYTYWITWHHRLGWQCGRVHR